SLFLAIGWQVLFATLAWPVFQTIGQGRLLDWGAVLLVLLAVKTLMMTVSLNQLISSPSPTKVSTAGQTTWIRLALETVIFAGIIFLPGLGHWLVIGFSLLLALCLSWSWFQRTKKVQGTLALDWTVALASSQKHDQAVWHFYSLFAQVPNQGVVVKRRSYLDRWLSHFSFQKNPARRLFWIKLLRGGDELVLVLRLVVVALVLLLVLPNQASYWQAGGIVLLVYLVNFQLLPVFEQSRSVLWTQLALGSGLQQTKTFLTVLAEITAMVVGLAFVVMLVFAGPLAALVVLGSGTLMGLVLHLLWLPKTLQKKL
ncbi:ABC transporter permease, partial [Fructobacillus ficulneus]|uniref:ABC transporter permease n=1 Tax=Fructobacillus ficulneus TaxID=157463 RepID=UPI000781F75B